MDSADKVPSGCELITAGGFDDLLGAWSSTDGDVEQLRGNHEEADTRLILRVRSATAGQLYHAGTLTSWLSPYIS